MPGDPARALQGCVCLKRVAYSSNLNATALKKPISVPSGVRVTIDPPPVKIGPLLLEEEAESSPGDGAPS